MIAVTTVLRWRKDLTAAFRLSVVILLSGIAAFAGDPGQSQDDDPAWLRGAGEQLEMRLSGNVTRSDGRSVHGAKLRVQMKYNDRELHSQQVPVHGGQFEVWLPVNRFDWYQVMLTATCPDGARCTSTLARTDLRKAVLSGIEMPVTVPSRTVTVRLEHEGKPVAGGRVRAEVSGWAVVQAQADEAGLATLHLLEHEKPLQLTAWNEQPALVGGYQFSRRPLRDPDAESFVISMYKCRPVDVVLKDANGRPIGGVPIQFFAATPRDFNYLGPAPGYQLVTDAAGTATVALSPDLKDAYFYAELHDDRWVTVSQQVVDGKMNIVAKPAVERKRVTGRVVTTGPSPAGLNVTADSFQGEQEHSMDMLGCFTDADGHFFANVLPDATYGIFINDRRWVSNVVTTIPFDSKSGRTASIELAVSEGIPVRIRLSEGKQRRPIAGAWVNVTAPYEIQWTENGVKKSGVGQRRFNQKTDEHGNIEVFAPEGKLKVTAMLHDWHCRRTIDVKRGAVNEIDLNRPQDEAVEVTGTVVSADGNQHGAANTLVHIRAIDGASRDDFQLQTDEHGKFRFRTKATKLGAIAWSRDKSFAGSAIIEDVSAPVQIRVYPTKSFSGKIVDQEGNPVPEHPVSARIDVSDDKRYNTASSVNFFADEFKFEVETDADGNYRIDGLPCLTRISIYTRPLDRASGDLHAVGDLYYLPNDEMRSRVTKIGRVESRSILRPLTQRYHVQKRDARIGHFHLLVVVRDESKPSHQKFIDKHLLDYKTHSTVADYLPLQVGAWELTTESNRRFAEKVDWPKAPEGVFVCVYDIQGKELARLTIDPDQPDAGDIAYRFLEQHRPEQEDAEVKWKKAFQQAARQDKKVWLRISQRYCWPCFLLNRWIDDHRDILEKHFVLVKVDDVRDRHGAEVAERLRKGRWVGVPFHAIFNDDENMIIDSVGPLGNIGYMNGLEGRRHFEAMLDAAGTDLTAEEKRALLESL